MASRPAAASPCAIHESRPATRTTLRMWSRLIGPAERVAQASGVQLRVPRGERLGGAPTIVVQSPADGSRSARPVARRAADSPAPRAAGAVHAHRRTRAHRRRHPAADSVRRRRNTRAASGSSTGITASRRATRFCACTPTTRAERQRELEQAHAARAARDRRRGSVPRVRRVGFRRSSRRRGLRSRDRPRREPVAAAPGQRVAAADPAQRVVARDRHRARVGAVSRASRAGPRPPGGARRSRAGRMVAPVRERPRALGARRLVPADVQRDGRGRASVPGRSSWRSRSCASATSSSAPAKLAPARRAGRRLRGATWRSCRPWPCTPSRSITIQPLPLHEF